MASSPVDQRDLVREGGPPLAEPTAEEFMQAVPAMSLEERLVRAALRTMAAMQWRWTSASFGRSTATKSVMVTTMENSSCSGGKSLNNGRRLPERWVGRADWDSDRGKKRSSPKEP